MTDLDLRTIKFLDGFHISFEILALVYSDLHQTCARVANDREALVPALWRCWSFIDTVHRLREMAQAVPRLSRRSRDRIVFLEETKVAEGFRHYIQHLRSELSKRELNAFPVWGSLAWVDLADPMCSHIVLAGAATKTTAYTGCVFDTLNRSWVSRVCLGVEGLSFNFDPIFDSCNRFRDFIVPWLLGSFEGKVEVKPELPIVTMRLVAQVAEAPNPAARGDC